MTTLAEALRKAGIKDPELAKIARTDISPEAAALELQQRYPDAFSTKPLEAWMQEDVRSMSPAELRAWEKKLENHGVDLMNKQGMPEWYESRGIETGEPK